MFGSRSDRIEIWLHARDPEGQAGRWNLKESPKERGGGTLCTRQVTAQTHDAEKSKRDQSCYLPFLLFIQSTKTDGPAHHGHQAVRS